MTSTATPRWTASGRTRSTSRSADRLIFHPLADAAARALPPAIPAFAARPYARLLHRRFAGLEAAARGERVDSETLGLGSRERMLSRRVLRRLEARWDDGDENLVRGTLDRWTSRDDAPGPDVARRLLQAAGDLARIDARAAAWWFLLWEMESLLPLVAAEGGC